MYKNHFEAIVRDSVTLYRPRRSYDAYDDFSVADTAAADEGESRPWEEIASLNPRGPPAAVAKGLKRPDVDYDLTVRLVMALVLGLVTPEILSAGQSAAVTSGQQTTEGRRVVGLPPTAPPSPPGLNSGSSTSKSNDTSKGSLSPVPPTSPSIEAFDPSLWTPLSTGDCILVFLPGVAEITRTISMLENCYSDWIQHEKQRNGDRRRPTLLCLPLHGALSPKEQREVFRSYHPSKVRTRR